MIDMNMEQSTIMWYFIEIFCLIIIIIGEPDLNAICYLIVVSEADIVILLFYNCPGRQATARDF